MNKLKEEIKQLIKDKKGNERTLREFGKRLRSDKLIRADDKFTHFAVFFIGYDAKTRKVLIGHHKRSGAWLPNGGHIEKGESLVDTLTREVDEEWDTKLQRIPDKPDFATVTLIDNNEQICRKHYDIWYFLPIEKDEIDLKNRKVLKEFHCMKWISVEKALKKIKIDTVHEALEILNNLLEKS